MPASGKHGLYSTALIPLSKSELTALEMARPLVRALENAKTLESIRYHLNKSNGGLCTGLILQCLRLKPKWNK